MIVFFLLLVIAAIALGILGIVVKGLLYLLFTGIGLLLVAFLLGAFWMRRRTRRRRHAR
jgi:membrane protein implicated in regulation of membrane protease activity